MKQFDTKKELGALYFPTDREPHLVRVPAFNFAMVDGRGAPDRSPEFQEAVQALYGVAFTEKFTLKKAGVADFRVAPLEALWSTGAGTRFAPRAARSSWRWTAMLLQPPGLTRRRFMDAVAALRARKDPPALGRVRWERYAEGPAVQALHLGPYAEEMGTLAAIARFIAERGWRPRGRHHEIYLGDPRRSPPDRLRTVLRQPVAVRG